MPRKYTPQERIDTFWNNVKITNNPDDCWEWQAGLHKQGYGTVRFGTMMLSHRVAWILSHGNIPNDLDVLHKCDNPPCCNPNHLFLGTHTDNMQDRERKGRHNAPCGENNKKHKLTENNVRYIRKRYAQGGITMRELANENGVYMTCVAKVIRRKTWKHVN